MTDGVSPPLAGRSAVVTGAGSGIGRQIAQILVEAGARVVACERDPGSAEQLRANLGPAVDVVVGDATRADVAEATVARAHELTGSVDVLVANVGGTVVGKIWELAEDNWDHVLRLNLRSTFVFTRAAVRRMIAQRHGTIVTVASGARHGTPWQAYYAGAAAYSTAKAGVVGFTAAVAREVAPYGVAAVTVAPGPIETTPEVARIRRARAGLPYDALQLTPMGRLGTCAEVAAVVRFLTCPHGVARAFTGTTIDVDGGYADRDGLA